MPTSFRVYNDGPSHDGSEHSKVRIFAGPDPDHRANCGVILMRNQEAAEFSALVNAADEAVAAYVVAVGPAPLEDSGHPDTPRLQEVLDKHLVTILDGLRHGMSVQAVAESLDVPAAIVARIDRDSFPARARVGRDVSTVEMTQP